MENKYYMKTGKAGELRVASELFLRGFNPSLMYEISEADIILDNGKKIQVKCSTFNQRRNGYTFSFKTWKRKTDRTRDQIKHELKNIDFVILWAIDDNRFFIIPVKKIREITFNKNSISLSLLPIQRKRKKTGWILEYEDYWEILNS